MQENSSLFSITIDPVAKEHLAETAKWARFLAIVGFVALVLLTGIGIYASIVLNQFENMYGNESRGVGSVLGLGAAITYLVVFLIYIFPIVFMFRFAGKMRQALDSHDQAEKIKSHLKIDTYLEPEDFLEVLLKDYNYLSAN